MKMSVLSTIRCGGGQNKNYLKGGPQDREGGGGRFWGSPNNAVIHYALQKNNFVVS